MAQFESVPEGQQKLAGGEASPRAGTTGFRPQPRMRPGRGVRSARWFLRPSGAFPFCFRGSGACARGLASPPANVWRSLRDASGTRDSFQVPVISIPIEAVHASPTAGPMLRLPSGESQTASSMSIFIPAAWPEWKTGAGLPMAAAGEVRGFISPMKAPPRTPALVHYTGRLQRAFRRRCRAACAATDSNGCPSASQSRATRSMVNAHAPSSIFATHSRETFASLPSL